MTDGDRDELAALEWIEKVSGSPPTGETWVGDDAAVLRTDAGLLLFATDAVVEGVHFLAGPEHLADAGWKVLVRNLSDIAAMGGAPTHAVAGVTGATFEDLRSIHQGMGEASRQYGCPVVGGDLSAGPTIVITVAILGRAGDAAPVLRSGARAGDQLFVTGPLGAANAGLRLLSGEPGARGPLVDSHRRPVPRIVEGQLAAMLGATSMIDVSDGLGIDLHRIADASGVGFALDDVPIASGASEEDAIGGGEDYELVFSMPPGTDTVGRFAEANLRRPLRIGEVVAQPGERTFHGEVFSPVGWRHQLD